MSRPPRLRPVNRGDAHKKLKSLKCFPVVHQKILDGWGLAEVARYIQETANEYTEVGRASLVAILQRYRDSIPPGQLVAKRIPEALHNAAEKIEEGIDELKELERLYVLQRERIDIDAKTEKNINKLLPTTVQEIRAAREILSNIADLKMDLGLTKRHLGEASINVEATVEETETKYGGKDSIRKVLSNPESRQKVLNIAQRFLELPRRLQHADADPDETPAEKLSAEEDLALLDIQEQVVLPEESAAEE